MTDRATVEQVLQEAVNVSPAKVPGLDAVVGLDLAGEGGGQWTLNFTGGNLAVSEGADPSAGATLKLSANDFVALGRRQLNPVSAFMSGKLKVVGNMAMIMKLQPLFQ
jgi:putative sterol carrier protein